MSLSRCRRGWGLLVVLVLVSPAPADGPRRDAQGDPLPEGAVARLGSARFRPGTAVYSVAWSGDGKWLVSTGHGTVQLWESSGRLVRAWPHHYAYRAAFTPDSKAILVCGSFDGVRLYDLTTEKEFRQIVKDGSEQYFALSADRQHLLMAQPSAFVVHFWDVEHRRELRTLQLDDKVWQLALAPDGKTAIVVAYDPPTVNRYKFVRYVLDTTTGRVRYRRSGKTEVGGGTPAVSPDGRMLAADNAAGFASYPEAAAVCVWEVATGQVRARLLEHKGRLSAVAFSPDGRTLAPAGADGNILLWDLSGRARHTARAGRPWTDKELAGLCDALAGTDAGRAFEAIQELAAAGDSMLKALQMFLVEVPISEEGRVPLGRLRAIEVLEKVGTARARQVLGRLAQEEIEAIPDDARAALRRLHR